MSGWTFAAHRALTGQPLHRMLPLSDVLVTRTFGGSAITGALTPAVHRELVTGTAADGLPVLLPWATSLVAANPAGEICAAGPVVRAERNGSSYSVECGGPLAWLGRQYWISGTYSRLHTDPLMIVRDLVAHAQTTPDAALGIRVVGAAESVMRLGDRVRYDINRETDPDAPADFVTHEGLTRLVRRYPDEGDIVADYARRAEEHAEQGGFGPQLGWNGMSPLTLHIAQQLYPVFYDRYPSADHDNYPDFEDKVVDFVRGIGRVLRFVEAEPYEIHPDELVNIGDEIAELAGTEPGFDLVEDPQWLDRDSVSVDYRLRLGYPRIGRRRHDLVLSSEWNTDGSGRLTDGEDYANVVIGRMRGEGSSAPWTLAETGHEAIPRVMAVEDLGSHNPTRLQSLTRKAASARSTMTRIAGPVHTRDVLPPDVLGDDVQRRVTDPWGSASGWFRVTRLEWRPEDGGTDVTMTPAASITYGPPA